MKNTIRSNIIKKRNKLTNNEVNTKSTLIFDQLKELSFFKDAKNVMLYISFNNEVLTEPIVNHLLSNEKRVFIPVTVPKTKELIVSELLSITDDLEIGTFGVLEPKQACLRPFSPKDLDLIIVPGLAFDLKGFRIGYGAGYYDRFLVNVPSHIPKVSLAFDLQIIAEVPNESYDIPVDYIITESKYIHCSSNKE